MALVFRLVVFLGFVALLGFGLAAPAALRAQNANLLSNPSFAEPYYNAGRSDLNMPNSWLLWVADSPRGQIWENRGDRLFAFPHCTAPQVITGPCSLNLNGGFVTFNAIIYQTVAVPGNAALQGSVYAWIQTCNSRNAANEFTGFPCGSAVESEAFVRVGIDPTGANNPSSERIVWGNAIAPHDSWGIASVEARAQGTAATFLIQTSQTWPSDFNNRYYDDAALVVGGSGGPAVSGGSTGPAVRPTQVITQRQPAEADGTQYHVVQLGETLSGISIAYETTVDRILQLNGLTRADTRSIRAGTRLLISR
jgi:hypothetical protein